jgi:NADP-dependent 3-hydroxy acid dehydrogenase YdfG
MPKLRDAVVIVTGASSGLGRATAVELADRGATLVLAARRSDALEDTARQCRSKGPYAIAVETDVTVEDEVQALAQRALEIVGLCASERLLLRRLLTGRRGAAQPA